MILLDSDHLTALKFPDTERYWRFRRRLDSAFGVELFDQYGGIQISKSDRKIAAITISNNALLLTANKRDFEQIPGLRFENWMD